MQSSLKHLTENITKGFYMIKIYVACLASYNNGFLHGKWFDLDKFTDADDLQAAITNEVLESKDNPTMLKYGEKCEEYAIHDFEAPEACKIGEYDSLERLFEMNDILNDDNGEVILSLKAHVGLDSIEEAKEYYDDNHCGEFKNDEEFAYDVAENCMSWNLSEGMGRYFDVEAFARDLMFEHFEIDGHYFRSA